MQRRLHRSLFLLIALALFAAACGDDATTATPGDTGPPTTPETTGPDRPTDPVSAALEEARTLWQANGTENYRYTFTRTCECDEEASGPFDVTVVGGEVTAVQNVYGEVTQVTALTVPALFDTIEATVADGKQVDVTYDDGNGRPVRVWLDLEAMAVDGGDASTIESLSSLDPQLDALAAAREVWSDAGVSSYELAYQVSCFCPQVVTTVTVVDGVVTDVAEEGDEGFGGFAPFTVADLFDEIEDAISEGAVSVDVTYSDEWGFPTSHFIDEVEMMADEEHGVQVLSFEPVAS